MPGFLGEHRRQVPGWKDGTTSGSASASAVKLGGQRRGWTPATPTSATPTDAVLGMQRAAGNRATAAYLSGSPSEPLYNTPDDDAGLFYNTRDGDEPLHHTMDWDMVSGSLHDDAETAAGTAAVEASGSASGPKERVKYGELKQLLDMYSDETTDTSDLVRSIFEMSLAFYLRRQGLVTGDRDAVVSMIQLGTLPPEAAAAATSAAVREKVLMEHLGWSRDDVARFGGPTSTEYITDDEDRAAYEVTGGPTLLQGGVPFDTTKPEPMYSKFSGKGWGIYAMGADGRIYAGSHKVGLFHHSSFLAGGDTAAGGELKVVDGKLQGLSNKSGHYKPEDAHLAQVLHELHSRGVSLSGIELKVLQQDNRVKGYEAGAWFYDHGWEADLLEDEDDDDESVGASPPQGAVYVYTPDDESGGASPPQGAVYVYEPDDEEDPAS